MTYANYIGSTDRSTTELATEVRLIVGRLTRRLRQEAGGGLTPSQLSVLASVEQLGPIHLGALARAEGVAPPTLTRAIDRLEELGALQRTPDPVDGRAVRVELTRAGRAAINDLRSARVAFLAKGLASLSDEERFVVREAVRLLGRMLEAT